MKRSLVKSYVKITVLPLIQDHFNVDVNIANGFGCLFVLGTGNTVIEAVKVLIEHGVQPSVIILLSLFSTPHGELSCSCKLSSRQWWEIVCIFLPSRSKEK